MYSGVLLCILCKVNTRIMNDQHFIVGSRCSFLNTSAMCVGGGVLDTSAMCTGGGVLDTSAMCTGGGVLDTSAMCVGGGVLDTTSAAALCVVLEMNGNPMHMLLQ